MSKPEEPAAVTDSIARDGVGLIRIDRPARRNALNLAVKRALVVALDAFEQDPAVRVVVLTGSDRWFVAGTDIAEMRDLAPGDHAALGTGLLFERVRACAKPVIAAVEGYALGGGCELALACDLVIASRAARFGMPEVRLGIMPGAGGTQFLLRAAGKHRALRLLLTGDTVAGDEALALGMVSEVVEPGQALDHALDLAGRIAAMPLLSVRAIRDSVRVGLEAPLQAALGYERRAFELLFASDDQREGMQAFLDKRPPDYKGR